jgi:hypothetical protein
LLAGASRREAEQSLNIHFAQQSAKTLAFFAGPELEQKLEKLMDLMAHKNFDRDLGKMVELLVDAELKRYQDKIEKAQLAAKDEQLDKVRGIQKQESGQTINVERGKKKAADRRHRAQGRNRYIPRETRRLVWAKYQGECSYKDPLSGKKCGSKHGIQIDHQHPISKGGAKELKNLTLLCATHNRWKGNRQLPTPVQ